MESFIKELIENIDILYFNKEYELLADIRDKIRKINDELEKEIKKK